jgi:uncharacterized protein
VSKINVRSTHRTLGYFYVGLIISFSISGIFLNHRRDWHPSRYITSTRDISMAPITRDSINDTYIEQFTKDQNINDKLRRFRIDKETLKISYEKNDVEINITSGKGTIETYKKTPVLGEFTTLHVDTSKWWIYYSDIFGLAMATIATTGMFIQRGNYSFKKHGWKLALAGIIFPLVFLFLLG